MLDTWRPQLDRWFIRPVALRLASIPAVTPMRLTAFSFLCGIAVLPVLLAHRPWPALVLLLISGYVDTLDGSVARLRGVASARGATLDGICDRVVEVCVLAGLYSIEPDARGWPVLCMLGARHITLSGYLIITGLGAGRGDPASRRSPGLIEHPEFILLLAAMMALPAWFHVLAWALTFGLLLTTVLRVARFLRAETDLGPRPAQPERRGPALHEGGDGVEAGEDSRVQEERKG